MSKDPFAVPGEPLPLHAGPDGEDAPALAVVEQDLRGLMRELAEARMSLGEAERGCQDRIDGLFLQVLEAMDAFDRVFRAIHAKQDQVDRQMKIWIGNFRTIRRLLEALLDDHGIKPMENVEEGFDPHWHRVVDTVADPDRPDGTIVEEVRRGYVRGTRILRKAEVVVVRNED
jgi:molecular chaperone GrpE